LLAATFPGFGKPGWKFSNDWKKTPEIFQCLEKISEDFPMIGKSTPSLASPDSKHPTPVPSRPPLALKLPWQRLPKGATFFPAFACEVKNQR
jgi:hypothetical protein